MRAGRRRRWPWAAGILVVLIVVAVVVALTGFDNDTTELSVSDAVERYREAGAGGEASVVELPEPGVYVYATTGSAEVDALNGATHTYPAETTLTVTLEGCGARVRWVGVRERWEERLVCPTDDGLALREVRTFREFFGQGDERTYTCDEGAMELPAALDTSFSATCPTGGTSQSGSTTIDFEGTVRGIEPVAVGGEEHEAVHVSIVGRFTGATEGEQVTERWLLPGGLLAREERRQRTTSDSVVGSVTYQETYALELTSTEPRG